MNEKQAKAARRVAQKTFDNNARTAIMKYVDRSAQMGLLDRMSYCWKLLRGKNPHTGKRPDEQ